MGADRKIENYSDIFDARGAACQADVVVADY